MDKLFAALENFKIIHKKKVRIDSRICELHYRFSILLLFTFSSIISVAELFGTPINCVQSGGADKTAIAEKFMNSYCYIQNTFIYVNQTRSPLTYPGIVGNADVKYIKYDSYYQWVLFILILHMFVLLVPHYLWKHVEDGLMAKLLKTNENYLLKTAAARSMIFKQVNGYLIQRHHSFYAYCYGYLFNNFFNTLAIIFNIYTFDKLLNGYFKYLGIQFLDFVWNKEDNFYMNNPLDIIFPKMTKCTFPKYGPSGSLMSLDAMCVMPLNNFNEKIFIILWFWYLALLFLSVCNALYKTVQCFAINCHNLVLMKMFFDADCILEGDMRYLQKRLDVGQWFFIDIVRLNLSPMYYREFLKSLSAKLQYKKQNNVPVENGCVTNGHAGHSGYGDGFES